MKIPERVQKLRERLDIPGHVQKLWGRLPRLPRKWRIVRNLAVFAALALAALTLLEWPAFSPYGAFHRLEGAYLLTPSRLVLQVGDGRYTACLSEGEGWIAMGSVFKFDSGGKPLDIDKYQAILHYAFPKEGMAVILLPAADEDRRVYAAVWGGPEEAVSGTLELDLQGIEDPFGNSYVPGIERFTAQAVRREDGWFIFPFYPHDDHREGQSCAMKMFPQWWRSFSPGGRLEQNYRLTLYDAAGAQAAYQSGTTPPDQNLRKW